MWLLILCVMQRKVIHWHTDGYAIICRGCHLQANGMSYAGYKQFRRSDGPEDEELVNKQQCERCGRGLSFKPSDNR